jgi:anti-anti-sigma factor
MTHASTFGVSSAEHGKTRRITVSGELDLATVPLLQAGFDDASRGSTRAVVLDLSALTFMDCAALHAVMGLVQGAQVGGWRLEIVRPPARVAQIFELTGTDSDLPLAARV